MSDAVSFTQINEILGLTDRLGFNREWIEIPLSTASPGVVQKLPNGKVEIVVDGGMPFEVWLGSLEARLKPFAPP